MADSQALPAKFPCWCRAVYSWGGESKKDLGFIEGDLIQCLNAGDGQWWMGRLHRDKRAMGLFPSNFVKVLDESFVPVSRGSSPMTSTNTAPVPRKEKSVFRKPFQAYLEYKPEEKKPEVPAPKPMQPIARAHKESTRRDSMQKEHRKLRTYQLRDGPSRQDSNRSYLSDLPMRQTSSQNSSQHSSQRSSRESSLQKRYSQAPQPASYNQRDNAPSRQESYRRYENAPSQQDSPQQYDQQPNYDTGYQAYPGSRRSSYKPQDSYEQAYAHPEYVPRATPPMPPEVPQHISRASSPAQPPSPPQHISRMHSPDPYDSPEDGPPPPPPPHRVAYNPQSQHPSRAPSSSMNNHYPVISRTPSPMPHSPGGLTPSPLRDAMDDVLDSLQDMSVNASARQDSPERTEPLNPWSPEAFEELRTSTRRRAHSRAQSRAQTSMAFTGSETTDSPYACDTAVDSGYGSQNSIDGWRERMESRLRATAGGEQQQYSSSSIYSSHHTQTRSEMPPPPPPNRNTEVFPPRPNSSGMETRAASSMSFVDTDEPTHKLRARKSAYELGKDLVSRTFTTKSTASTSTNAISNASGASGTSNHTLMSGASAGGFSATSAGSFARRKFGSIRGRNSRPMSIAGSSPDEMVDGTVLMRPESQMSGPSYHPSHTSQQSRPFSAMDRPEWAGSVVHSGNGLGGLAQPDPVVGMPQLKSKRSGFLRKLVDSAKAGAANARSTIASGSPEKDSRRKSIGTTGFGNGIGNGIGISSSGSSTGRSAAEDMGLGGGQMGVDWMQVRRDVNRSNSLSAIELQERAERAEMMNQPAIRPVDALLEIAEGDEGLDGMPISEPTNFQGANLQLVDKAARFVTSLPPMTNSVSLAQGYLCRQYRSDVQRLRAIFTWVSERIAWEEDFEGEIDARRVIHARRGCAEEVAVLVEELCQAVGLHAEVVHGFLKGPGDIPEVNKMPRPNHWWNAVLVDGEWRVMDCSLASPTNPKRSLYSSASAQAADSWYFLARPLEACYTHVPLYSEQQHIVPAIDLAILLALPCACPPFFKHGLSLINYDTSVLFLDGLEVLHLHLSVPYDVELHAEVESRSYARDPDGDAWIESGGTITTPTVAQPDWIVTPSGAVTKRYTVKALLPPEEREGKLLVYAGKRGLMHSVRDNPHGLALSLPIVHNGGQNPPFEFFVRHPTPHAQRHDLYVTQPQCKRLAYGNTFVFAVRQHPSSVPGQPGGGMTTRASPAFGTSMNVGGATSPLPFRPGSALSMSSSSASGSNYGVAAGSLAYSGSSGGNGAAMGPNSALQKEKPAKLAIQSPSGKILRMSRKVGEPEGEFGGGTWETYIKVGEKGTWRGLVLADRSARWCVFAEWECV